MGLRWLSGLLASSEQSDEQFAIEWPALLLSLLMKLLCRPGTLRQSNAAFTLSRCTQTDSDELMAAQQMMVDAIFGAAGTGIQ